MYNTPRKTNINAPKKVEILPNFSLKNLPNFKPKKVKSKLTNEKIIYAKNGYNVIVEIPSPTEKLSKLTETPKSKKAYKLSSPITSSLPTNISTAIKIKIIPTTISESNGNLDNTTLPIKFPKRGIIKWKKPTIILSI